ncbi:MAG: metalloprotease [Anaerolineae bacterium]
MIFQPPPTTPYDLQFTLFGFPVRIHPLFWLIALLFGLPAAHILDAVLWVVVVLVSITLHELGHACAMRMYGQEASIVLYYAGGLAIPEGGGWVRSRLEPPQQIVISFAGPLAGFITAGVVVALVMGLGGLVDVRFMAGFIPVPSAFLPLAGRFGNTFIRMMLWVNVFWGLINLLPVFPLDGGRIAQQILLMADPWEGVR